MANKMFRFGLLAMVLVFGLTVIGCKKGGVLTVTDFPAHFQNAAIMSTYVYMPDGVSLTGGINDDDPETGDYDSVTISGGTANIPLWYQTEDGSWKSYSGSGTGNLSIHIVGGGRSLLQIKEHPVTFSRGNARISYNDFEQSLE